MTMSRKGFTLIELLVVVSIIAILAGLLIPAIGNARYNGLKANDINNAKRIAEAAIAYSLEEGGMPDDSDETDNDNRAHASQQRLAISQELPARLFESKVNSKTNIPQVGGETEADSPTWTSSSGSAYNYDFGVQNQAGSSTPLVSNGGDSKGNAVVAFGDASTITIGEAGSGTSEVNTYYLDEDDSSVDRLHIDDTWADTFPLRYDIFLAGAQGLFASGS